MTPSPAYLALAGFAYLLAGDFILSFYLPAGVFLVAEFIVGVTGGIGSGKTLVTDAFAAKGVVIADADEAARHIVEPGQPALAQIVAHFGEEIIDSSGRLDRPKLRKIVFNDVDARRQLESFTHRPIMETLANQLQSAPAPMLC